MTVDWEGGASVTRVEVFPVGTTDYNARTSGLSGNSLALQAPNGTGRGELKFTAPKRGSMPLVFQDDTCPSGGGELGPYDFAVYVNHAVRLFVPNRATLGRRATVNVAVHDPEGEAITDSALRVSVQILSRGRWRTVGSAPVANSTARVRVNIPRSFVGQRLPLRARAQGPSYLTQTSNHIHVRIR